MKPEVLQTLLTAKVLLNKAQELCFVEDKFTASSGLIILQDAMELIFLAALVEIGVDEQKSLENFSFDQLIGELKTQGINVIKSGTLKALNKQRVIIKHYGQVSEPQTVGTYYAVAHQAANEVLEQVVGKGLHQVVLNELIRNEETNKYLTDACEALEQEKYFKCLTNIRKAIFIEIEQDYCIYEWRNSEPNEPLGLLEFARRGGTKAPYYTRNKAWIEQNVNDPYDYIQRDHDRIRQDLLEWGASTQDFWNVWRLTPEVMRLSKESDWLLKGELKYLYQAATKQNAIFCLDRAVTLISKKQSHHGLARWLDYSARDHLKVRLKGQSTLFKKASSSSEVLAHLPENNVYDANSVVPGMDGNGRYVSIFHIQNVEPNFLSGYVDIDSCELLKPGEEGYSK
jgi:hypothetical protein